MPTQSSAPADSQPSQATTPTVLPQSPTQGAGMAGGGIASPDLVVMARHGQAQAGHA
jgi:hypothetical protein